MENPKSKRPKAKHREKKERPITDAGRRAREFYAQLTGSEPSWSEILGEK
jgi:hypothetical protein